MASGDVLKLNSKKWYVIMQTYKGEPNGLPFELGLTKSKIKLAN